MTASRDAVAKVWDARTGSEILILIGHGISVDSAFYNPDGKNIVTTGADQTVKVWNAETGVELYTLTGHSDVIHSAVYSPDGKRIMTASSDQTIRVYTTDIEELLAIAKSRATRQLTVEERERYGIPNQ